MKPMLQYKAQTDISVRNEGGLFIFWLNTPQAIQWADEHCADAQRWGQNGLVVEHRYAGDLAVNAQNDGLTLS